MKKNFLFLLMSLLLVLTGCNRDDDFGAAATLTPVPFAVTVKYDPAVGGAAAPNTKVVLKNTATGEEVSGTTDANGELKLTKVLPGTYNITASATLTKAEYSTIFGLATNQNEVAFNGSQQNVTVNTNVSSTTILLSNGRVGDFVIKQYYYAGSDTSKGALFRDQFIEIYNNSNQVMYADGLYIALLDGNTNNTVTAYTLSNGQFDWSQSVGNNIGTAANTDYVYASTILKIPGSGTTYPIQPGKSFIVAQTAINHKAPYTNNAGQQVTILDPSLTVDLSTAEFETYLGDYATSTGGTPYMYDIQNPAVPDVGITYWGTSSRDLMLNINSRPAVVIFNNITDATIATYPKVPNPSSPTSRQSVRLPKNIIMDGVDTTSKSLTAPKDLPNDIDAGWAYIKSAAGEAYADYTSMAVIRKTKTTINGRIVLEDTNNSTNDFVTIKANPRAYAP